MMKTLAVLLTMAVSFQTMAFEDASFKCQVGSLTYTALPGVQRAPESPVVALQVKVLENQVPLFLVQADVELSPTETVKKNLFITDWTTTSNLSAEGQDLLSLLSFFYGVNTGSVEKLRAAIETDIVQEFAFLELVYVDGTSLKLGFEGINPQECQ